MFYNYSLLIVEQKKKKAKKIIIAILTIIAILCGIFVGIVCAKKNNEKRYAEQLEIENQKILEEQRKNEKEELQRLRNFEPLTLEQISSIENIYSSPNEKRVFLTFDDGPTKSVTPFILDLLKEENIKATFFVLGNRAKANPDLIKREFEEGHYIANHGYTHKYSTIYKNTQSVIDEYNYTETCIQQALENQDYHSRVFRFPGGSTGGYYNSIKREAKSVLKQNNISYLDWNCLTKDAEGAKTKEALLQNAINTMKNKNSVVILMHDSAEKILTYEMLPELIQYLRENGYSFKNLYDIL